MARPQKVGLDYFPLDVDIDQDDKVAIIEAQHGLLGFAIVIKLLMKIYSEGYYYDWTEKEQILFSKKVNVNINEVDVIINDCVKWGLFDKKLYDTHKILTSRGIQLRYFEIVKRRKKVEIAKQYLLLNNEDINLYTNIVIVNINEQGDMVSDDKSTQSKVKESKGKESKVTVVEEQAATTESKNVFKVFEENIHLPTSMEIEKLKSWLEDFEEEVIIMAIEEAVNRNARNMAYINAILNNWENQGLKTKDNVIAFKRDREDKNNSKNNKPVTKGKNNNSKLELDHDYDMDAIEKKLLKRSGGG